MVTGAVRKIERELAYSAARSDIECCCVRVGDWYRSTELSRADDAEAVKTAMRYLEYRGLLQRHPDNATLIRPVTKHSLAEPRHQGFGG